MEEKKRILSVKRMIIQNKKDEYFKIKNAFFTR